MWIQIFQCFGELLTTLTTLDLIIDQNDALKASWAHYKHMISMARADPASFKSSEHKISSFERLLVALNVNVLGGDILRGCIEQNFEVHINESDEEIPIVVRDNQTFLGEMLQCVKNILDGALAVIGKPTELYEREDVVGAFALYALYRQLVPPIVPPDAKMQKFLWSVQKTLPMVVLGDKVRVRVPVCVRPSPPPCVCLCLTPSMQVVWYPAEFLQTYAPYDLKKPDPPNPAAHRKAFLQQFDQSLAQRVQLLVAQTSNWFVLAESRLQASLRHEESVRKAMDLRGSIVLKGLGLACRASYMAKFALVMHAELQVCFVCWWVVRSRVRT